MSYRVAILYRGKTLPDIFAGVKDVKFSGNYGWPCVRLIYENGAKFINTADITTMDVSEEEDE